MVTAGARGLFACEDGKDQESTGEDGFASYALKMWGKVIGDANMEKRGTSDRPFPQLSAY
jgi:endo-1,3(4)-beta-glucanase